MAVALRFLAVRALSSPLGQKVLQKYGPTFFGGSGLASALERFHRIEDWLQPDEALTLQVSGPEGYPVQVATYNEPFELRKLQLIWSVSDAATAQEDARVCTFHWAKLSGGAVVDTWVGADFTTMQNAILTWWGALAGAYQENVVLDRMKVYKAGPAIVPPQPPVYDADLNSPGLNATPKPMPPQVAISVTEISGTKRHWGRFYLPAPTSDWANDYGRITSGQQTAVADATDTFFTTMKTAGLEPVVYRAPLPARFTRAAERAGATEPNIPARSGSAWTVEKIQVDDVFDVIRRRRFKYPTLRVQRDI